MSIGIEMSVRPDEEYVKRHAYTAERLAVLGGMRLFKLISHIYPDDDQVPSLNAATFL